MSRKNRKPVHHTVVDVALLTAGYVDPPVLQNCVYAIQREMQTVPSELYVCRNGKVAETKAAYDQILSSIPSSHIKNLSDNVGFPRGANTAIRAGNAPLVLFISDDIILHEGTLEKLVRTMDDKTIGLCGLKLIFPPDNTIPGRPAGRVQHIGHAIDAQGRIVHPLLGWSPENPKCCISRELQSVTGAAFIVRRDVFRKAGGFFEGYGKGYFEDVDLNLTIRTIPNGLGSNYKIWINAEATAYHYVGATFVKKNEPTNMEVNQITLWQRKGRMMVNDTWTFW